MIVPVDGYTMLYSRESRCAHTREWILFAHIYTTTDHLVQQYYHQHHQNHFVTVCKALYSSDWSMTNYLESRWPSAAAALTHETDTLMGQFRAVRQVKRSQSKWCSTGITKKPDQVGKTDRGQRVKSRCWLSQLQYLAWPIKLPNL